MAIPPTDINWIEKYGNMDWGNAMKTGDFGLTDAERDSQLQRTIAINNQEMAKAQARREVEQAAVNQPAQGAPMPGYRPAPMMGGTYPYQIPNRNFTWQTTPQEQMALAGRMNRQDLQPLLGSGEYGPLAGQQYRYTPQGTTQINYGPGGGFGGGYGGFPPWQTQPIPPWQQSVVPTGDGRVPVGDGRVPVGDGRIPVGDGRIPVGDGRVPIGDDWTPGPVTEGEEWNFRPEDFRGPLKDWTAPVNPYGTTPQGYQTREQFENMQDFKRVLAAQPMGTSTQGIDFSGMPSADVLAARQAAASIGRSQSDQERENAFLAMSRFDAGRGQNIGGQWIAPFTGAPRGGSGVNLAELRQAQIATNAARDQARQDAFQAEANKRAQRQREIQVQAQEFAPVQRAAEVKKQREAAAKPKRPSGPKRAAVTKAQAKTRTKEKAKAVQKARQLERRRVPPPQIAKPKRTVRRPPMKASVKKAASQAAARARNKEAEKKKEKRAAEAKKKGYRIGPSGRK